MFITESTQDESLCQHRGTPPGNDAEQIPQPDLFQASDAAHAQPTDLEQKEDLLAVTELKIRNLRRSLISVPVQDIQRIVEINDKIRVLESDIHHLSQELLQASNP